MEISRKTYISGDKHSQWLNFQVFRLFVRHYAIASTQALGHITVYSIESSLPSPFHPHQVRTSSFTTFRSLWPRQKGKALWNEHRWFKYWTASEPCGSQTKNNKYELGTLITFWRVKWSAQQTKRSTQRWIQSGLKVVVVTLNSLDSLVTSLRLPAVLSFFCAWLWIVEWVTSSAEPMHSFDRGLTEWKELECTESWNTIWRVAELRSRGPNSE